MTVVWKVSFERSRTSLAETRQAARSAEAAALSSPADLIVMVDVCLSRRLMCLDGRTILAIVLRETRVYSKRARYAGGWESMECSMRCQGWSGVEYR